VNRNETIVIKGDFVQKKLSYEHTHTQLSDYTNRTTKKVGSKWTDDCIKHYTCQSIRRPFACSSQ